MLELRYGGEKEINVVHHGRDRNFACTVVIIKYLTTPVSYMVIFFLEKFDA